MKLIAAIYFAGLGALGVVEVVAWTLMPPGCLTDCEPGESTHTTLLVFGGYLGIAIWLVAGLIGFLVAVALFAYRGSD